MFINQAVGQLLRRPAVGARCPRVFGHARRGAFAVAIAAAALLSGTSSGGWSGSGPLIIEGDDGARLVLPGIVHPVSSEDTTIFLIEHVDASGNPVGLSSLTAVRNVEMADGTTLPPSAAFSEANIVRQGVLWNDSQDRVRVLLDRGDDLAFVFLDAGEGLLIGANDALASTHVLGCACKCSFDGGSQVITVPCPPDPGTGNECDCSLRNNINTLVSIPDPGDPNNTMLVSGTSSNCVRSLIPRN